MPLRLLSQLLNPATLKAIGGLILIIVIAKVIYYETVPPEHCVENTQEVRNALSVKGVEISNTDSGKNKICFRSKDGALIKEISQKSQDSFLQLELKKIEGKQQYAKPHFTTRYKASALSLKLPPCSSHLQRQYKPASFFSSRTALS